MIISIWMIAAAAQTPICKPFPPRTSPSWAVCLDVLAAEARAKPTVGDIVGQGLKRLHGKPVRTAFAKLGYPDAKMTIAGDTVYSWRNAEPDQRGGANLAGTIKVISRRGMVLTSDFHGNNGACEMYARVFDPTFKL